MIFLPGLSKQIEFLFKVVKEAESILVVGSSSEQIALRLFQKYKCRIELIVEDYESLMNSKLILSEEENINVRMMSFESTDFGDQQFDLIFAQASISLVNRNKIIKELKRIAKPDSYLCLGEITLLKNEQPAYIKNILDASNLLPLYTNDIENYYIERGLTLVARENYSTTLRDYYTLSESKLNSTKEKLTTQEQSYYKKLLNKISHEANAYLKLGGDKLIGFEALLLRKGDK